MSGSYLGDLTRGQKKISGNAGEVGKEIYERHRRLTIPVDGWFSWVVSCFLVVSWL